MAEVIAMSETAKLLFANDAFYTAFANRDSAAMEDLWARQAPLTCIHPGWQTLISREAVLDSWRAILASPRAPQISCRGPHAFAHGELGLVVCYEVIGASVLAASNVFVREGGVWKLMHHQAGPCEALPADVQAEMPPEPMQ
jgi:hypothetical protein